MIVLYIICGFLMFIGLFTICFILRKLLKGIKYILETPKIIDEFVNG